MENKQPQRDEEPPDTPFGEDITNPDSRTMPLEFHGEWVRDLSDCQAYRSATRKVISSDRIVEGDDVQRVVAVRFIDTGKVAVVTLPAEGGEKEYSLFILAYPKMGIHFSTSKAWIGSCIGVQRKPTSFKPSTAMPFVSDRWELLITSIYERP